MVFEEAKNILINRGIIERINMIYECKICGKHWIDDYAVKNNNMELFKKGLLSHIEVKEEINNPTNIEEYFDIYENYDERVPSYLINS